MEASFCISPHEAQELFDGSQKRIAEQGESIKHLVQNLHHILRPSIAYQPFDSKIITTASFTQQTETHIALRLSYSVWLVSDGVHCLENPVA